MKHTVILDFSHLYHLSRSMAINAPPPHTLIDSIVFHAQGKLRTLHRLFSNLGVHDYDLIFAEDCVATRKLALMPNYRAGRENRSEEKLAVKAMMKERGCQGYWCRSEGNEADDTIATLVTMAESQGIASIIVTGDRDLWQLIGDLVVVMNPIKKELVNLADIEKAFQVQPVHIPMVKAFWGDAGDCVPNVLPRMQKHFRPIIKLSDGTFDDCHSKILDHRNHLDPKCFNLYRQQEPNARRNYELVKLDPACPLTWE